MSIPPNSCDDLSARDQRSLILHLLYAMDAFEYGVTLSSILDNFSRGFDCTLTPDSTIIVRSQGIIDKRDELDEHIKPLLHNWRFDRIGVCTRLILRIALWELMNTELPPSMVMNEAVELAKCFAEVDAHKFVNGILDEWTYKNRPPETSTETEEN